MTLNVNVHSIYTYLETPELVKELSDLAWQDVLRILRHNELVATLAGRIIQERIPVKSSYALRHLKASLVYANRQAQQVEYEARNLLWQLGKIEVVPIFLKGAAYTLAKDANAIGRLMSDVDILVKSAHIAKVEAHLKHHDWREKQLTNYDDKYYRQWAHELPPFRHATSGTTLDVHHTLIPPITGKLIPIELAIACAKQTNNGHVLSEQWRLLHCIIHFFYNEDYSKPARDVWDLRCLFLLLPSRVELDSFIHFSGELGFRKEVGYACELMSYLFHSFRNQFGPAINTRLSVWEKVFCKAIVFNMALPRHSEVDTLKVKLSCFVMFVRGHIKKMPLKILLPHAVFKLYRTFVKLLFGRHHFD